MIDNYRIFNITKPLKRKMVNSLYTAEAVYNVVLEVRSGEHSGYGYVFSYKRLHQRAISLLIEDYMTMIMGKDPADVESLTGALTHSLANIGDTGLAARALSLVDSALWDLRAREAGLPLYKLVGGTRTQIPLYVGGGWLGLSDSELCAEAVSCVEKGYKAYKFKVSSGDNERFAKRVAKVRKSVGDDIELMVDANQGFKLEDAIDMSKRLADSNISWFEEPLYAYDIDGYIALHKESGVRIASGESVYLCREQKPFVDSGAIDVIMPDLARTSGPTVFMRVADMAEEKGIPVSPHWFTEISAHLVSRCKYPCVIEYVEDMWDDIFVDGPKIRDGIMYLADSIGTGISLDYEALEHYKTL